MTDHRSLIEKLEAATEGSRELDLSLDECVARDEEGRLDLHATIRYFENQNERLPYDNIGMEWLPHYTTSLDDARSISDWILLELSDIGADGLPLARLGDPSRSPPVEVSGIGADLILSLCIAGVKARTA